MNCPFRFLSSTWLVLHALQFLRGYAFCPKPPSHHRSSSPFWSTVEPPETSPLAPHTFAGMIENGIKDRFGNEANRVIESLRLKDREYEHNAYVGPSDRDPETSNCRQVSNSYVPGLTIREFWDTSGIPWAQKLKSKYKAIRDEFEQVTADMDRLLQEGNNIWAGALTQDAASYGEGWSTLVLKDRSYWDHVNAQLFPVTSKTVHDSGVPAVELFFASLKPNSNVKPHSDFTNFLLTSHLCLDIPYSGQNKCRLTIGDETREWINGEIMLFDTSLLHDAVNESDKTRYILMMRVWHPDLTPTERDALQFIYDCLTFPELVTGSPEERAMAEKELARLKSLPKLATKRPGFGGGGKTSKKKKGSKKK